MRGHGRHMDEKALQSMLDDIPVGIVWVRGGDSEWQNALVRGYCSRLQANSAEARLKDIVQDCLTSRTSPADKISWCGREFYVGAHFHRDDVLVMLIPVGTEAPLFPSIDKTNQSALDFEDI